MTIASKGTLGNYANTSNNQTGFSLTTATTTLSVGNLAVLIIAVDNDQTTDGDENCVSGVTDSAGNPWRKAAEFTNGEGAAQAGTTCSVWFTRANTQLSVGGTITGNFSVAASRDESAGLAWAFTCDANIGIDGTNTLATDATSNPGSLTQSTVNAHRLRLRGTASELNSATDFTGTPSWTTIGVQRSTNIATAQSVRAEFIISTSTGNTSNPTGVGAADHASVFVNFMELPPLGWEQVQSMPAQVISRAVGGSPM